MEKKFDIASKDAIANHSFFFGATNENIDEVLAVDGNNVCGIKIFMGSSTGNMLVDNEQTLRNIFGKCKLLIATHCEDEVTVRANEAKYKAQFGEDLPIKYHPIIRDAEACYKSSSMAVNLAKELDARLHILHISSAKETALFRNDIPLKEKRITAEACIHHLWFTDAQYDTKGTLIKWNPAVKKQSDKDALLQALLDDKLDVIATDHAPHAIEEKLQEFSAAPFGISSLETALSTITTLYDRGELDLEIALKALTIGPASTFRLEEGIGKLTPNVSRDVTILDANEQWVVDVERFTSMGKNSPLHGHALKGRVKAVIYNGSLSWSSESET